MEAEAMFGDHACSLLPEARSRVHVHLSAPQCHRPWSCRGPAAAADSACDRCRHSRASFYFL